MLVTDAMPPVGGRARELRAQRRRNHRARRPLHAAPTARSPASALDMASAVRNAVRGHLGMPLTAALRRGVGRAGAFLGLADRLGPPVARRVAPTWWRSIPTPSRCWRPGSQGKKRTRPERALAGLSLREGVVETGAGQAQEREVGLVRVPSACQLGRPVRCCLAVGLRLFVASPSLSAPKSGPESGPETSDRDLGTGDLGQLTPRTRRTRAGRTRAGQTRAGANSGRSNSGRSNSGLSNVELSNAGRAAD